MSVFVCNFCSKCGDLISSPFLRTVVGHFCIDPALQPATDLDHITCVTLGNILCNPSP